MFNLEKSSTQIKIHEQLGSKISDTFCAQTYAKDDGKVHNKIFYEVSDKVWNRVVDETYHKVSIKFYDEVYFKVKEGLKKDYNFCVFIFCLLNIKVNEEIIDKIHEAVYFEVKGGLKNEF